ncbi:PrsW family glutamic-type intramembrane protease [Streptomyces hygroscopicus]|uniref:PrsW family glutamic-type intramembrane protease n=1 Tax=Streptomyces hygroscopicus TaxID=1912 RepID=UPI00131B8765|nr:PrsW family glutamic-type intramembrane protease [Streptomyces hygroscopicus]
MVQLLVLSSPTRSVRVSTVLLAVVVGVYGCGVAAALLELAYTRSVAGLTGQSLAEVVASASYTVDPVIEELVKAAPLLLAGWNFTIRRQWGLTDHVVLGAGVGAGFGLVEAVTRFGLDADRAIQHSAGGWAIPDSLRAPYIPGPEQIFSAWFPAPQGTLELGDLTPEAGTSPHLVYTALAALGIGLLLRARGWIRALGVLPVAAGSLHHMLTNYVAQHPTDQGVASLADVFEGMLWAVPLVCLGLAVIADSSQLRRGKAAVPGILLRAERSGHLSLTALAGYAAWCVPWSTLIALRFARLRRSLLYAAATSGPYPGFAHLHRTVAWTAGHLDATDHEHAWKDVTLRSVLQTRRRQVDRRRKWFVLVSLGLTIPSLLLLGIGSFPTEADLQEHFASGDGPNILIGFGIAGLLWTGWLLTRLLRAWRVMRTIPYGEALATIRFRIWTALGGCITGVLLLTRLQDDAAPDGPVIRNVHLLEALNNFLTYLGFALTLLALLALFPPGAGLAVATTGVVGGAVTTEAAIHTIAFGTLGIVLMAAASDGSGPSSTSSASEGSRQPQGANAAESSGEARVKRGRAYEDYLQEKLGGDGAFKEGRRQFDGSFTREDGTEVWYEAKSGKYWELANRDPKVMSKFKANLGEARQIAEMNGKDFSLISEEPIPEDVIRWLSKKKITWQVISKEAG